jgi:hypothetical protein
MAEEQIPAGSQIFSKGVDNSYFQPQPIYGDNKRYWIEDWSADGRFLLTHDTETLSIIPVTGAGFRFQSSVPGTADQTPHWEEDGTGEEF